MITIKDFDLKKLELQNNFYNLALQQIDFVKSVLKKYDGKKITKRIETELNKNNNNLHFFLNKKYDWWSISLYCNERCYQTAPDKNGYCGTVYIDCSEFYYLDYYKNDVLHYEEIEKSLNEKQLYYTEKFKKQNETLKSLNFLISERNVIIEKLTQNTEELRNLSECFSGYNDYVTYKIR